MATLAMSPEEEERDRLERVGALGMVAGGARGRSARPGAGGGTGGTGPAGGAFVGLDKFAAANESSTQALGDKVVGSVGQAGTDARSALGQSVQDFDRDVGLKRVDFSTPLINRFYQDPSALAKDTEARTAFEKMRDASYTGPRLLEETGSFGNTVAKLGEAERTRELAGSDRGVSELSDKSVQGPRSSGGRSLDTALLLGDSTLRGRLNTARDDLGKLGGEYESASNAAAERGTQAAKTTDQTRTDTRQAITTAQNAFRDALDANVAQKRLESFYRAVNAQDALKGYNSTPGYVTQPMPQQGGLDPGLANLTPADIAALQALPPADLARLQQQRQQQLAQERANAPRAALPTTGVAGRYYAGNDPTQPEFRDGAVAGNVPEFIHNSGGEQMLPGFRDYVGRSLSRAPTAQELADLGITPQDWAELAPLAPVVPIAEASAMGTSNVNPYSFLEDYQSRIGDLSRFATIANPNVTIQRENLSSADDYARAGALEQLAGQELAQRILDPAQAGMAGTADLDLVSFDKAAANRARNDAIAALMERAGMHVAGNARSGSDSFLKQYGWSLNPLDPRFAAYSGAGVGGNVLAGLSERGERKAEGR
jgi:hypothetical protein